MSLMKEFGSPSDGEKKDRGADKKSVELRSKGDQERDNENWDKAAQYYQAYLNSNPDDFPIWVQLGNCSKEAGNFIAAEEAYRRAIDLRPDDADVHLQYGHLMKRKGSVVEAVERYTRSLELDPTQRHALMELRALGVDISFLDINGQTEVRRACGVVYYDIFDLIQFLRVHLRVTGIQRVVINIVANLLADMNKDSNFEFCAVTTRPDGHAYFDAEELFVFEPIALRELIAVLNAPWLTRKILDERLETLLDTRIRHEIRSGDVYVILGAFWLLVDYGPVLQRIKEKGALIGTYIYDLIPITHPQFVMEMTGGDYRRIFADILLFSDFFLSISDYTNRQLRHLLEAELNVDKPIHTVPLAHEQPKANSSRGSDRTINAEVRMLAKRPFVMVVSTLEGRKNHLLLYRVWSSLVRKHGFEKVPQLVLVGKWGWRIDEFRTICESSNFLDGKISVLTDLRDDELFHLYERCMFTILPSFVEGWGLAVGESLAFGKPCLASNAASIPEVGGDLVAYFDPYDTSGASELIEQAIFQPEFLAGLTARIKQEFQPRSWQDVASLLDKAVKQTAESLRSVRAADPTSGQVRIPIDPGKLYEISGDALLGREEGTPWLQRLIRLIRYAGWSVLEPWGSWSIERQAQLRLGIGPEHAGKQVNVYLELRLAPGEGDRRVLVSDGLANTTALTSLSAVPKWVKCQLAVDESGFLDVFLARNMSPPKPHEDQRGLRVGLSGFGYCLIGDTASQLDILEDLVMRSYK